MNNEERNNNNNGNTVLLTVIGVATLLVALVGATFAYFSATITNNSKQSIYVTTATPVGLNYVGNANGLKLENTIPGESDDDTFEVTNPETSTVVQTYDLDLIIDENTLTAQETSDGNHQLVLTVTAARSEGKASYNAAGKTKGTDISLPSGDVLPYVNASDNKLPGDAAGLPNLGAGVYDLTDGATYTSYGDAVERAKNPNSIDTDVTGVYTTTGNKVAKGSAFKILNNQEIYIGETQTFTLKLEFRETNESQDENQARQFQAHFEVRDPVSKTN